MDKMAPAGEIYGHLMTQSVRLAKVTLANLPIIPQTDVPRWFKIGKTTAGNSALSRYAPQLAQEHVFWLPTTKLPDNFEDLVISFITYIAERDGLLYKVGKEWFYLDHDHPKRFLDSLVECLYIVCTLPVKEFLTCTDDSFHDWMKSYDWRENIHALHQEFDETWTHQNYFRDTVFDTIIEHYLEKEEEYDTFNLGMLRTEAAFSQHGINMIKQEIKAFHLQHAGHYNKDEFTEYYTETVDISEDEYIFNPEEPDGGMANEIQRLVAWNESDAHYEFLAYLGSTYLRKDGVSITVAKQAHSRLTKITNGINNLRTWSLKMMREYMSVFDYFEYDEEQGKPYNTIYDIFRDDKNWWKNNKKRVQVHREVTAEEEKEYNKIEKQIAKEAHEKYSNNRKNTV